MKKIFIWLNLIMLLFLVGCTDEKQDNSKIDEIKYTTKAGKGIYAFYSDLENPTINYVKDETIDKQEGIYDPLKGIVVNDLKDGIIDNDRITVIYVNLTNNVIINEINLNIDGKYRIEYEVKDNDGYLSKTSKILIVGKGIDSTVSNNVPYITGGGTFKTDLINGVFDPLTKIFAYDSTGHDITSRITYSITNEVTQKVVKDIDLSITGKYIIDYQVKGSNDVIATLKRYIIVGDSLGSALSFSGLKGIGYVYDYDKIDDYKIIFSDEFDTDGSLNPQKFTYDIGNGQQGWGNWELQYYTNNEKNVKVVDGNLVITAIKEQYSGFNYTSAKVKTDGLFNFKYGIVEIRAKLPTGVGTWPALWMMPNGTGFGTWPLCGEIDIMEHVGYNQDKVIGTVHTGAFNGSNGLQKGGSIYVEDASNTYHTYKMEWLPDVINFYVDNVRYFSYSPSDYSDNPKEDIWPFDKEYFLIFNIAVGGMYGGMNGVDEDIWPQSMFIDYVRVYQSETISNLVQLP